MSEDLRQLQGRPPEGTALETALKVTNQIPVDPDTPKVSEKERYFTAASDPSQESAVLKARLSPGLVIQGPPGTGKSQTIVNMVGDCIGRGESVLVVCQKLPALQVVAKRLQAEGLSDRFFLITNVNADRRPTLQALRQQLQQAFAQNASDQQARQRAREALAARIEAVQEEIDEHHQVLHRTDWATGLSYRALIGELLAIEDAGPVKDTPRLRALLGTLDRAQLSAVEEACGPLAPLWLEARYESSALACLTPFGSDSALIAELARHLQDFVEKETKRDEVIERTHAAFDIDDPAPHRGWLDKHGRMFRDMDVAVRRNLAQWYNLFNSAASATPGGHDALGDIKSLEKKLAVLDADHHDAALFVPLFELSLAALSECLMHVHKACTPLSILSWLNFSRISSRRRVRKFLPSLASMPPSSECLSCAMQPPSKKSCDRCATSFALSRRRLTTTLACSAALRCAMPGGWRLNCLTFCDLLQRPPKPPRRVPAAAMRKT